MWLWGTKCKKKSQYFLNALNMYIYIYTQSKIRSQEDFCSSHLMLCAFWNENTDHIAVAHCLSTTTQLLGNLILLWRLFTMGTVQRSIRNLKPYINAHISLPFWNINVRVCVHVGVWIHTHHMHNVQILIMLCYLVNRSPVELRLNQHFDMCAGSVSSDSALWSCAKSMGKPIVKNSGCLRHHPTPQIWISKSKEKCIGVLYVLSRPKRRLDLKGCKQRHPFTFTPIPLPFHPGPPEKWTGGPHQKPRVKRTLVFLSIIFT